MGGVPIHCDTGITFAHSAFTACPHGPKDLADSAIIVMTIGGAR